MVLIHLNVDENAEKKWGKLFKLSLGIKQIERKPLSDINLQCPSSSDIGDSDPKPDVHIRKSQV